VSHRGDPPAHRDARRFAHRTARRYVIQPLVPSSHVSRNRGDNAGRREDSTALYVYAIAMPPNSSSRSPPPVPVAPRASQARRRISAPAGYGGSLRVLPVVYTLKVAAARGNAESRAHAQGRCTPPDKEPVRQELARIEPS
jgi:hypothetical protein